MLGGGERDTRIVRYHIGKFLADGEFEISLFISIEDAFPYSPFHLYLYSASEYIPQNIKILEILFLFFLIFKDI